MGGQSCTQVETKEKVSIKIGRQFVTYPGDLVLQAVKQQEVLFIDWKFSIFRETSILVVRRCHTCSLKVAIISACICLSKSST